MARWCRLGTLRTTLISIHLIFGIVAATRSSASESTFVLKLGLEQVEFFVSGNPSVRSPLVLSLHRDENTAFPIVREILSGQPGRFVGIKTPGKRRLFLKGGGSKAFSIDPNRMFSKPGIEADLRYGSFYSEKIAAEIAAFSDAYLKRIGLEPGVTVIAVHNNTDGRYSLESYREGGSESKAGAKVHEGTGMDADDFILVTNPTHFDALEAADFNVVLQANASAPDDGSLSVYCGRNEIDYFNVEAEFGHKAEQELMLRAVFALASGTVPAGAGLPLEQPVEGGESKKNEPSSDKPESKPGIRLFKPKAP